MDASHALLNFSPIADPLSFTFSSSGIFRRRTSLKTSLSSLFTTHLTAVFRGQFMFEHWSLCVYPWPTYHWWSLAFVPFRSRVGSSWSVAPFYATVVSIFLGISVLTSPIELRSFHFARYTFRCCICESSGTSFRWELSRGCLHCCSFYRFSHFITYFQPLGKFAESCGIFLSVFLSISLFACRMHLSQKHR